MAYNRGDVLLAPFPFSNLTTSKVRPAIVISSAVYHASEPDLILAAITSNLGAATSSMDYILNDWQAAGLRYPSAFKPVLFTLDPTRVIYQVGAVTPTDMDAVNQRLRHILNL